MSRAVPWRRGRTASFLLVASTFLAATPMIAQSEAGLDTKPSPAAPTAAPTATATATPSTTNAASRPGDSLATDALALTRQPPPPPDTTATRPTNNPATNATASTTASTTANATAEPAANEASGFIVIINASNPTERLPRKRVARLFLKKIKKWEGWDESVEPVDQKASSEQRERFSDGVHGMRVGSIKEFWLRMIFSGRGAPPEELASDQAVIAFVAKTPGGIGYVSATTPLDARVKPLTITD